MNLYKYGLAVISRNRLLLCRPFAFPDLILPGGIKEGAEDHLENLTREVREELRDQAELATSSLEFLGTFKDKAAGRNNKYVEIELYKGEVLGDLKPSSEIKDLIWHDPSNTNELLSPILKNQIVPFLISKGFLTPQK